MMDCFSPTFSCFCRHIKSPKKHEKLNFLLVGFTLFLSSQVFLLGISMDSLHLVIDWKTLGALVKWQNAK